MGSSSGDGDVIAEVVNGEDSAAGGIVGSLAGRVVVVVDDDGVEARHVEVLVGVLRLKMALWSPRWAYIPPGEIKISESTYYTISGRTYFYVT